MKKYNISICVLIILCCIHSCYCDGGYYDIPRKINILCNYCKPELKNKMYTFRDVLKQAFKIYVSIEKTTTKDLLRICDQHNNTDQGPSTVTIILDAYNFYKHNYNEILKRNYVYAGEGFIQTGTITANKCTGKYYKYMCDKIAKEKDHKNKHVDLAKNTSPMDKQSLNRRSFEKNADNKTNKHKTSSKFNNIDTKKQNSGHTKVTANKTSMEVNCKKNDYIVHQDASCEIIKNQYIAKLVSINVLKYPAISDFINDYDGFKDLDLSKYYRKEERHCSDGKVYVCRKNAETNEPRIQCTNVCYNFDIDASTIAIQARTPNDIKDLDVTQVTTIFSSQLETSFEGRRDTEAFIDSFHWMPIEKTMYAMVKFLERVNRNRVAIISDDLPSNQEYEKHITELLERHNFIYASRSCDVSNCDFAEVIAPLVAAEAKIIIANIDENNQHFAKQVKQWPHLIWFCKSFKMANRLTEVGLPNIFLTTMTPPVSSRVVPNKDYYQMAYTPILEDVLSKLNIEKPYNHRDIAAQIKHQLHEKQTIKISIKKCYTNKDPKELASMDIPPSNIIHNYVTYGGPVPIYDELSSCTIKSSLYFKPCYDTEFIYIMLVIAVLLIMVLAIAYYLHSIDIPYTRMRT